MTLQGRLKKRKKRKKRRKRKPGVTLPSVNTVKVDFHCHSSLSFDGYFSPEELAEKFAKANIRHCAVTDHDTIKGQDRFKAALTARGIDYITGAEISVSFPDANFHLLAYGFKSGSPSLEQLFEAIDHRRIHVGFHKKSRLKKKIQSLARFRRPKIIGGISLPEIDAETSPAEVQAEEIIHRVHEAGGIACLAHPLSLTSDLALLDQFLKQLKSQGLDGLEAIYKPYPSKIRRQLIALGEKHQLVISCGSDYHGYKRAASGSSRLKDSPFHYSPMKKVPEEPGVDMPKDHLEKFLGCFSK